MPTTPNIVKSEKVQGALNSSTEQKLIAQIAQGDESALTALYDKYHIKIVNYLENRNKLPKDVAKAIANNVMFDLYKSIRKGKYKHTAQLNTFLTDCAIKQSSTWWTKEIRQPGKNRPIPNLSIRNSSGNADEKATRSQDQGVTIERKKLLVLVRGILNEENIVDFLNRRFQMPKDEAEILLNSITFDFIKKETKKAHPYIYRGKEQLRDDLLNLAIKQARYYWGNLDASQSGGRQTDHSQEAPWQKTLEFSFSLLDEEEKIVVEEMCELERDEPINQRSIAKKHGWALGRVNQIKQRAEDKLKAALYEDNNSETNANPNEVINHG